MSKTTLPKYLLLFVLACLVLPFVQKVTGLIKVNPLKGFMTEAADIYFSKDAWFSGEYQTQKEKRINETFGFRNWGIRIYNQMDYSFFKKSQTKDLIVGKETYLYEKGYIRAYTGEDFTGEEVIHEQMKKLEFVCDSLGKLNKTIILVFAPSKGFYYPEYIPEEYNRTRTTTNIERYIHHAKALGIHYIDFNQHFIDKKSEFKHLLYPKHGVHWSMLGSDMAADSIVRYIEKVRGIDMPNLFWKESETVYGPDTENEVDYDIANSMNLLFKFPATKMKYPNIQCESSEGKTKPNVIVIGDSFYWGMYGYISKAFSENSQFWYYNKSVFTGGSDQSKSLETVDVKKELEQHEVYIILATPMNLATFSWGFVDNTYKILQNGAVDFEAYWREVQNFKAYIRTDKAWLEGAEKRSIQNNIPVDSVITLDAIYQVRRAMEEKEKANK